MNPEQFFILPLAQAHEARLAGGKACNLARLIQAGFPVPGGFVVTTAAYSRWRALRQEPSSSGTANAISLPEDITAAILSAYHDLGSPVVAVRSSATAEDMAEASMAGQYETFLDVQGDAGLLEAIQRCWAGLNSSRASHYLREHQLNPGDVAMAVVVQELIPAEVAGVLFTANPRTGALDEMLIEAVWGLGEALVSGLTQPDMLVLDQATGTVRESRIADKQLSIEPGSHAPQPVPEAKRTAACLNSKQVYELWKLGRQAADFFGSPQDLEWALHRGKIYLLQSRAITTLQGPAAREQALQEARDALSAAREAGHGPWVTHNLGETLPHPTPLTWSVMRRFMSGDGGFGAMYRLAGFAPGPAVRAQGFLDLIAGRIYMDLSRASEMFFEGFPFSYDLGLLRANPAAAQDAPSVPAGSLVARHRAAKKLTTTSARLRELAGDFDNRLERETMPEFVRWVEAEKKRDLRSLSVTQWLEVWAERERRTMDDFAPQSLLPSLIAGMALDQVRAFLAEHIWDEEPELLANLLAAGGPPDKTLLANQGLYEMAQGKLSVPEWLQRNGHRAPMEFDLATPRWRERPEAVQSLAAQLKSADSPLSRHEQRCQEVAAQLNELKKQLSPRLAEELDSRLELVRRYLRYREDGKYYLIMGCDLLRDLALEAGRRLEIGEDIFFLSLEEVQSALTTGYAPLQVIRQRRCLRSAEARLALPHFIADEEIKTLGQPVLLPAAGRQFKAFPVSTGFCTGPVRNIHSPEEAGELEKGSVLVCPSTDPNWTPLFANAAGLVLECGGMLSHGAVVAREMGLPAVVLPGATRLLQEGESVSVDGRNGTVVRNQVSPGASSDANPTNAADSEDTRIPAHLRPPPPGERERRSARIRNTFLLVWGLFLALAFLLPEPMLYRPSMELLDVVLWPLAAAWGKPAVVAFIAGMLAILTMAGQRILTDNSRLVAAKQRANALRRSAVALPQNSPRRQAIAKLASAVQMRIMAAAFVPLAIILGPMVMTFLWFPERVDPASWNAEPGAAVNISAEINGDFLKSIRLEMEPALKLDASSPAIQSLPPIRGTLEKLLANWQKPSDLSAQPWEVRAAAIRSREAMMADLSSYLQRPIPPQMLAWTLHTPEKTNARYHVNLLPESSTGRPVQILLAVGGAHPPAPREVTPNKSSPLRKVTIKYREQKTEAVAAFWIPFKSLGWKRDAGWLLTYLAVYLPVMLLLRWLLKVA